MNLVGVRYLTSGCCKAVQHVLHPRLAGIWLTGIVLAVQPMLQGPLQIVQNVMNSVAARMTAVAALALAAVWGVQASGTGMDDPTSLKQMLEVRSTHHSIRPSLDIMQHSPIRPFPFLDWCFQKLLHLPQ